MSMQDNRDDPFGVEELRNGFLRYTREAYTRLPAFRSMRQACDAVIASELQRQVSR